MSRSSSIYGGGGLSGGTTPGVAYVPSIGVGIHLGNLSVRLDGRYELPQTYSLEDGGLRSSFMGADVALCGQFEQLFGCGVFDGGFLTQQGVGIAQIEETTNLVASTGIRAGGDFFVTDSIGIRVRGEVEVNLVEVETTIEGEQVWEMPPLAGQFGTFVFWRFD